MKCHIIRFGYRHYAVESLAAATKAIEILSKLKAVEFQGPTDFCDTHHYEYVTGDDREISLELNQQLAMPPKYKALPRPKRGTKRCLCNHSDVAPGEVCVSCGLSYNYSC